MFTPFDDKEDKRSGVSSYRLMSEINITPFVDVMLVLLVIFMVTAPILVHGIRVHLPSAAAHALKAPEKTIVVAVRSDRNIYINKFRVGLPVLTEKLAAIYKHRKDKQIFLKASSSLSY